MKMLQVAFDWHHGIVAENTANPVCHDLNLRCFMMGNAMLFEMPMRHQTPMLIHDFTILQVA